MRSPTLSIFALRLATALACAASVTCGSAAPATARASQLEDGQVQRDGALLQGGDDARVPPTDALRLASALQALGRSYRLKVHEGGSHDLLADYADVRVEMDRWFDRYVRDRLRGPRNAVTRLSPAESGVK